MRGACARQAVAGPYPATGDACMRGLDQMIDPLQSTKYPYAPSLPWPPDSVPTGPGPSALL